MFKLFVFFTLITGAMLASTSFAQDPVKLKVALFPYVPTPDGIEEVVQEHWRKAHPDVDIEFVKWDCYDGDPPADIDVFETDAIFLDHLVQNSFAAPLALSDLKNAGDVYRFAVKGSMVDGALYGIPRLACRPILFFREGDSEVKNAKGINDLFYSIGASRNKSEKPPKKSGLLIDLSGGTTCACYYLDAIADITDSYQIDPALPKAQDLNDSAIDNLQLLTLMSGTKQALYENWDGQRARWFADGHGQAFVGWTERLSMIPEPQHAKIELRGLPLAGSDKENLIFVDTLCINPTLSGKKRELAIEFANLAASSNVVLDSLLVENPATESPQYLLPCRKSVVKSEKLLKEAPLYSELDNLLEDEPKAFRIDDDVRPWLESTKGIIQERITAFSSN